MLRVVAIGLVVALVAVWWWLGTLGHVVLVGTVLLITCLAIPIARLRGWWRWLGVLGGLIAFVGLSLGLIRLRFGGGERYPDVSTAPLVPEAELQTLVTLDYPPGNVAIAPDGRTFFNYHPFAKAERFASATMFELVDGVPRPYPDAAFQSRYLGVFGMTIDHQQRLWLIEPASIDRDRTRLLAFDLKTNALVFEYLFESGEARFAQDLRVSPDGATVYLADTGLFQLTPAALYVFDVASSSARRVNLGSSMQPQKWIIETPFGAHKLAYGLVTFSVGLDGIELSPDGAWLYYGTMSHDTLYKVPTNDLSDDKVVAVGTKPLSDGITLDPQGRALITDIEHGGIARLDAKGALTTLVKSHAVIWADGIVVAPDGAVVFTDSAIPAYIDQLARPPALDALAAHRPYHIYRFTPR